MIPTAAVQAASVRLDAIPSLRIAEGWYSNVYNASGDEVSSPGTRVSPGIAFKFTSADNVTLHLSGNYEKVWYHDPEAEEADYNTWFFRLDSTGGWKLTPTLSMLPSVYYVNTTNSYRRVQLLPSGDPLVPPVTITNYGDVKSQDFGGGLSFEYLVSPNVSMGLSGNYVERRFPDDNVSGSGLKDSSQAGGGVSVSYSVSPRTKVGLSGSWSRQTFEGSPNSDTYSGGFLYSYQFSPASRLEAAVGASHIRQESATGQPEESKTSPTGTIKLVHAAGTFSSTIYGSYVYSGGSGFGESTRQGTVGLILSDQFTREWSWNLSGAYQVSKSVFTSEAVDLKTRYGAAGLRYQPWQWAGLDLTGSYSHQTSDGLLGIDLETYSAVLGFTIGRPYNIY